MGYIDITRPLTPTTAVWPGDQPVEWTWTARREEGSTVNLGAITASVHAGSHADAPLHVRDGGAAIDELPLEPFAGTVDVVRVDGPHVTPADVEAVAAPRILFRTAASDLSGDQWPDAITAIHPEAIRLMQDRGVQLIGTDAPSIDPLDSQTLDAHHAMIDAGMVNLEGLDLSSVSPGRYVLMAFPLKIPGADAAPVRAVLAPEDAPISS
jgi:arylformamidase